MRGARIDAPLRSPAENPRTIVTEPAAPTDAPRLCALAKTLGVTIDEPNAAQLLAYLDAMLFVNEQINLTAVRDREQAVVLRDSRRLRPSSRHLPTLVIFQPCARCHARTQKRC